MRCWPLVLALAFACSSSESGSAPPETPSAEVTREPPEPEAEPEQSEPEGEPAEPELFQPEASGEPSLEPAPGYDHGCEADTDCVIATDPCARAFAVHRDRESAFRDQFRGRQYRCPMAEYPSEPVAHCREGRCVGVVP